MKPFALLSVTLACPLAFGLMGAPAIGVAVARGYFQIDNSKVYGNSTVFDGSHVLTSEASSALQLDSGAHLLLGLHSQARIYRDRAVLERNQAQWSGGNYYVEAAGLRVVPKSGGEAAVSLNNDKLDVAAVRGTVLVSRADGLLLARITPGTALEFDQTAGAAADITVKGTLKKKTSHLLLKDTGRQMTYDILCDKLDKYAGKAVEVTGTPDPSTPPFTGADEVLRVHSCNEAAAVLLPHQPNGGTATAKNGAGMALKTKMFIVGGVSAAAATGTALATISR